MAKAQRQPAARQDPATVDPKHYKVESENEKLRVLRIKYGPGEKSVMHGHPAAVAIFLSDARFRFTFPDGRTEERQGTTGQAMIVPAEEHLPEKCWRQSRRDPPG